MKTALLTLLTICFIKIAGAQQYSIQANITGFPDGAKFYLTDVDVDADIDSAVIKNNSLVLSGTLTETPKSLWLHCTVKNKYYYTTLMMGNDTTIITGDMGDFPFYLTVKGPKLADDHNAMLSLIRDDYKRRNELLEQIFALKGDSAKIKGKRIWKVIRKIDSADDAATRGFIKSHLNSYEALNQLFYLKGNYPKDTLQAMYNSLAPVYKQSLFGQRINNYLKVGDILKEGDAFADFEAFDKDGRKHRLGENAGKYTLLDFSTTYCGPCIGSLEDLKIIAKKYAGSVQIVSFSGDGGKATWLKGIARDQPDWLSLWDGKGNYGETILKYGITGYPSFFLIDPQGKIVSKWVGYEKSPGQKGSLETKIDELLTKK